MYTSIFKSRSRRQSQQQRNKRRFNLACESLEGRQLLSSATPQSLSIGPVYDSLTYGTTLGSAMNPTTVQDAHGHAVAGTFDFVESGVGDVTAIPLDVGHYDLSVTFNPTDMTDYSSATTTASIDITQAKIVIVADSPTITYGDSPTLTNTLYADLGPDPNLPGQDDYQELDSTALASVAYTSALGGAPAAAATDTILSAGDHTINPTDISTLSPTPTRNEFLNDFDVVYGPGTLTVTPATLTITANDVSGTYGTVALNGTSGFTETGLVSGDSISSVTLSTNATTSTSGNYNVSGSTPWTITPSAASGSGLDNYSIAYDNAPTGLTVTPQNITASLNGAIEQKTYDGNTTASLGSDYTLATLVSGDQVTLSATGNYDTANVGSGKTVTYTGLTLGGNDVGDYSLTTASLSDSNGEIDQATLTITANDVSGTYGTVALNGTSGFTETGLVSGDSISSVTLSTNATTSTSGNYNVSGSTPWTITPSAASGSGLDNYSIAYDNAPTGLTVTPQNITASLNGAIEQKTYDGNTTASLGSDYTLATLVSGDQVTLSATGNYDTANVGSGKTVTYTGLTLGGNDVGDYSLTTASLSDSNGEIDQATLTITANDVSGTYGTVALNGTSGFTETGLVSGDSISSVTLSTNATTSTSGNYNVSGSTPWTITPSAASGSGLDNYSIAYDNAPTGLTVTPQNITASLNGAIEQKTYDGNTTASLGSDYTLATLVSGDQVTLSATGNYDTANVGSGKTVTYTGLTLGGNDVGDYSLTTASLSDSNGEIDQATLTITANDVSGTYGTVALNGTSGFTETGLVSGDSISSVTLSTNATTSTSGNYNVSGSTPWTITPSAASGSGLDNYSIAYDNAPTGLTVTPATLIVTANNTTMVLGGPVPTFSAYYIGLVNGDAVSSLGNLNLGFTHGNTTVSGTSTITLSGNATSTDSDYTIVYDPGTLTVNAATNPIIIGLPPSKKLS